MDELTQQFFTTVLPATGPYVLAFKGNYPGMAHRVYNTIDTLPSTNLKGINLYFSIGSIKDPEFKKDGKISPRNQKNVKEVKVLPLDIDIKEDEKFYHTQEEALEGIWELQKDLVIPEPTIVSSGYGIHAYHSFSTAVDKERWQPVADKYKLLLTAKHPKIAADGSRIADACGLLRVPGTLNYKNPEEPREVKIINLGQSYPFELYEKAINDYIEKNGILIPKVHAAPSSVTSMLDLATEEKHSVVHMIKKCNWVRVYISEQKSASEPDWYKVLGLVKHLKSPTKNSEELAHVFSIGHPGYSEIATAQKYAQVQKAQTGPTTCAVLRSIHPDRCAGCPYAELITTPVRLDTIELPSTTAPIVVEQIVQESGEVTEKTRTIPNPPAPYYRGEDGSGIFIRLPTKAVQKVYDYDLFPIRRLRDEETGNELLELSLSLPQDGRCFVTVPASYMTDAKKMAGALADKGAIIELKKAPMLTDYIIKYAQALQREEKAVEEFARFGWRDYESDKPRFVMGEYVINTDGSLSRATPARYLKEHASSISVRGDLEKWKAAFNVYTNIPDSEAMIFSLMLGFGAPLMTMTAFHGMIYNMCGESGCGKSTASRLTTSIFGKPDERKIQVQDNRIALFNKVGYLQSLPISFDEITNINSDLLADLAYAITEGRGKDRADRSGNNRVNTVRWKTIVIATSNTSLYDKLGMAKAGNNAHAYRILEVNLKAADSTHAGKIDEARAAIEHNYGIGGRIYLRYIVKNRDKVQDAILAAIRRFSAGGGNAERFWVAAKAIAYVGGAIAKQLGLHTYNVEKAIKYVDQQLGEARNTLKEVEGNPVHLFSHFLQQNLKSILKVRDGKVDPLTLDGFFNKMVGRFEQVGSKSTLGYISVLAIRDYCKQIGADYSWLTRKMQENKVVKDIVEKKLGEGTNAIMGTTKSWVIDLTHPVMSNIGE